MPSNVTCRFDDLPSPTAEPGRRDERSIGGPLISILVGCAALVLVRHAIAVSSYGETEEEHLWRSVFGCMRREGGFTRLFTEGADSFRPVCASVLELEDLVGMTVRARFAASLFVHVMNLAFFGSLVGRVSGARAGVLAFALAAIHGGPSEITTWLGARCELLYVCFGVVGAHATLSAVRGSTPRARSLALACAVVLVCASALSKETGFLLPLVYLPLFADSRARAQLAWLGAPLLVAFLYRAAVLGGPLGAYVMRNLAFGPPHLVRQGARALSLLFLGDGIELSLPGILVATCAGLATATFVVRRASRDPDAFAYLVALAASLAPSLLKSAPRTIYATVLVAAAGVATLAARRTIGKRIMESLLLTYAAVHVASSFAAVHAWSEAYAERASAISLVDSSLGDAKHVILLAPRERFHGIHLGALSSEDLGGRPREVTTLCEPPGDYRTTRRGESGPDVLAHRLELTQNGPGTFVPRPREYPCRDRLSFDPRLVESTLVLYVDTEGSLRRLELDP